MTTTFRDLIHRILQSSATNEGADAMCTIIGDPTPVPLRSLLERNLAFDAPAVLRRTLRNWEICSVDGVTAVQSHPWDETPNVANVGMRNAGFSITALTDYATRLESLANEAERIRAFAHSAMLWRMSVQVREQAGLPVENAKGEAARLAQVVEALVAR